MDARPRCAVDAALHETQQRSSRHHEHEQCRSVSTGNRRRRHLPVDRLVHGGDRARLDFGIAGRAARRRDGDCVRRGCERKVRPDLEGAARLR